MRKLMIDDLKLKGKKVLVRVDFNVPLDDKLNVRNDKRIRAALPTIQKIMASGGRTILMSHLGRPDGQIIESMRMAPVAKRLSELLGKPVKTASDCVGTKVEAAVNAMKDGEVMLLENLRFHKAETDNDPAFAKALAALGDVYVNDAFGTAHRAHASTEGVTKYFDQCASGYLMYNELKYLGMAITDPERPFVAILGGAKISGKIDVINTLFEKVDTLLIGGGMTYTFYKAKGQSIGDSLLEADKIELAKKILKDAAARGIELLLPVDNVVATKVEEGAESKVVSAGKIPDGWNGVDIGPETVKLFKEKVLKAKTVVWNGPMGVFEIDAFAKGTDAIATALAQATAKGTVSIIGGGDSAAAIEKAGLSEKVTHVSTGGGASLEFLGGITLPGVAALTDVA
ncbi:phosphoglycerate kinase [candidate division KSB1 bacterium]|nr:phosphoglycerate kinase [candidate division KSB1 bacterium]